MDNIKYYNENAKSYFNETVNLSMEDHYKIFTKYLNPGDKILDAGCGSGRDSLYFLNNNFNVVSIDGSEELTRLAAELTGQNVMHMNFYDINFENEFHAVWASASILHVDRKDIPLIIDKLLKGLKKSGIFFMSFKYGDQEINKGGRYFNYFNEETIKTVLSEKDITMLEMWITNDSRTDRKDEKWLNLIIRKN